MFRFPQALLLGFVIPLYLTAGCSVTLFDSAKVKKIEPAQDEPTLEFTDSSPVLETIHTSFGILWRTDYGFFLFDNEGNTRHISMDQGLPSDRITVVAEGLKSLWIGTDQGLASLRDGAITTVPLPWDEEPVVLPDDSGTASKPLKTNEKQSGNKISTGRAQQTLTQPAPEQTIVKPDPIEVTAIAWSDEYLGQAPAIWVGSEKGLVTSADGKVFVEVFSGIAVNHIMTDSTATVWVATDSHGIIKVGSGGTLESIGLGNGLPSLHVDNLAITRTGALLAWNWGNNKNAWIAFHDQSTSFWQGFSLAGLNGPAQLEELTVRDRKLMAKTDSGFFEIEPFRKPDPIVLEEGQAPPPPPKLTMKPIRFTPQPPVLIPEDPFTTKYGKRTRAEEDLYSGRLLAKLKGPTDRKNARTYDKLKNKVDKSRAKYIEARDIVAALVLQLTQLEDQIAIEREKVKSIKSEALAATTASAGTTGLDGLGDGSTGNAEGEIFIFQEEERLWQMEDTLTSSQEKMNQDREKELAARDNALDAQQELLDFVEKIAPPGTYPQWLKQSPWSNFYNATEIKAAQFPLSAASLSHPPMTVNQWHIPDQSLTNSMVVSMNGNRDGELFLGTASLGLLGIQRDDKNSRWFRANDLIPSSRAMGPAIDKHGNTWVISRDGGLFRHLKGHSLEWERMLIGQTRSRAHALAADRQGRIQVFNQVSEGWRLSRHDGTAWQHSEPYPLWLAEGKPVPNMQVTSFDVDGGGKAYLALALGEDGQKGRRLQPAGVLELSPGAENAPVHHLMDPSRRLSFAEPGRQLPNNRVNRLRVSANGMVWMATMSGLVRLHGNDMQLLDENRGLPGSVIRDLLVDNQDRVWIALSRGVALVDKESLQFEFYAEAEGLPSGGVQEVFTGEANMLWALTEQGLAMRRADQFAGIETASLGINLSEIQNPVLDQNNRLWAVTRDRLMRYKALPDKPAEKPKEDKLEVSL